MTAAQNAKARGEKIVAVFNLDGIGAETAEQTAAGKRTNVTMYTEPEGKRLAELMTAVKVRYGIGLQQRMAKRPGPGDDDGSFVKAGYRAAVVNIGSCPYGDPKYHAEGDIPQRCDIENAARAVQATLAAVLALDQDLCSGRGTADRGHAGMFRCHRRSSAAPPTPPQPVTCRYRYTQIVPSSRLSLAEWRKTTFSSGS